LEYNFLININVWNYYNICIQFTIINISILTLKQFYNVILFIFLTLCLPSYLMSPLWFVDRDSSFAILQPSLGMTPLCFYSKVLFVTHHSPLLRTPLQSCDLNHNNIYFVGIFFFISNILGFAFNPCNSLFDPNPKYL